MRSIVIFLLTRENMTSFKPRSGSSSGSSNSNSHSRSICILPLFPAAGASTPCALPPPPAAGASPTQGRLGSCVCHSFAMRLRCVWLAFSMLLLPAAGASTPWALPPPPSPSPSRGRLGSSKPRGLEPRRPFRRGGQDAIQRDHPAMPSHAYEAVIAAMARVSPHVETRSCARSAQEPTLVWSSRATPGARGVNAAST